MGDRRFDAALYELLYAHFEDIDGVVDAFVLRNDSRRFAVGGILVTLNHQTLAPFEAELDLDPAAGTLIAYVLRVGMRGLDPRDAPAHSASWRVQQKMLANRPMTDDGWAHVIRRRWEG